MIASSTKHRLLHQLPNLGLPSFGSLDFVLPPELNASEPPEARGMERDEVRLMVSYRADDHIIHTTFRDIPNILRPGDVVVINTSGTLNAALEATDSTGKALELHLSTHLPADLWIVEVRQPDPRTGSTQPYSALTVGTTLQLPGAATATLLTPYVQDRSAPLPNPIRLWVATLQLPSPLVPYLSEFGFPIRYSYVKKGWSSRYYQTVYATEPGSAEMPSAGRAFTPNLMVQLIANGIQIAPLLLHTGVASLEEHEPPYEEWYRVPAETAQIVTEARRTNRRIIAVGTTVVRALETVTDADGITHPGEGWTREIITPERGIRSINGLLTGFHEPRATHLAMLAALASIEHLDLAYTEALSRGYLWHEFGDLHLILP